MLIHSFNVEALESDDSVGEDVVIPSVNATFEHPEHIVTVTTVDDIDLTSDSFTCIGPNKVRPVVTRRQRET